MNLSKNLINQILKKFIIISLRLSEYFKNDWKIIERYNQNKLNKFDFIKEKYLNF